MDTGYLTILRWRGTPIRLHWTLPLGALVFSGLRFAPVFWLAFFGLVLVHEVGHALLARRFGQRVLAIDVTGFGGLCRFTGVATPLERALIAWGGVAAQAVVLAGAFLVLIVAGPPGSPAQREVASVLVGTNAWLIAVNLLPVPPLDGAEAWRAVPLWLARRERRGGQTLRPPPTDGRSLRERVFGRRGRRVQSFESQAPDDGERARRELAATLRRIGDEAARARRGT